MDDLPDASDLINVDRGALVQVFLAESAEVLSVMEQQLLFLEANPADEESVLTLFRAAHTLKGSSSLLSFDSVSNLAHELEDLLVRLRSKVFSVNEGLVTLLLRGVDLLRATIRCAAADMEAPPDLASYADQIRRAGRAEEVPPGPAPAPLVPEAGRAAGGAEPVVAARTLRVDVGKLDRMLNLSGEIAISRGRLTDMLERRQAPSLEAILEAHRETDRLYLDLQALVMQARMVPLGPTFQQHYRTVRDLAASQQKRVRLVLEGEDVEVDTALVEHVRDPLTHLVRNAVDHGIETPQVRRERGKDPCGRLTLRALCEGALVVIQLVDDGAGLDAERLARRGVEQGLVPDGRQLTAQEAFSLIFEPGFTTRDQVTSVSGRGVGMDIVRKSVDALRGSVSVESEFGHGMTVTLRLPLTLAIIEGFQVRVGGEVYILPLAAVVECLELPAGGPQGPTGVLSLRGRPLPFLRLREYFGVQGAATTRENVVVVQHEGGLAGVAVDELLGECQTVIKPLGRMLRGVRGVSGSAILGDGRVALILDVPSLLSDVVNRAGRLPVRHE